MDIIDIIKDVIIGFIALFLSFKQVRLWKADRKERREGKCELHSDELTTVKTELNEVKDKISKIVEWRETQAKQGMEIDQLKKDFRLLQRRIAGAFRRTNKKIDDTNKKIDDLPLALKKIFDQKLKEKEDELD